MKKTTKRKAEPEISLELIGRVDIVEKIPGKRTKRTVLNGETVLECILLVLRRAMGDLEQGR